MAGVQEKQLRWYNIALMSFITVWGFGNVVNNYANQGLVVSVQREPSGHNLKHTTKWCPPNK